ncbi:MAG: hypothetical protein KDK91_08110 [Gammaproteobacteria bacterium]|nr:hypothetical protein [Gammaproteobacteria bacterium]
MKKHVLAAAIVTALASGASSAADGNGEYLAGDFHNHTACSDGWTSVKTLARQSLVYLDWFVQVGHSGSSQRDCRFDDFYYYSNASSNSPNIWYNSLLSDEEKTAWLDSGALPEDKFKGNNHGASTQGDGVRVPRMWKWQEMQDFMLEPLVSVRNEPGNKAAAKEAMLGLEWVVPGHEHGSDIITAGQYDPQPNANAMAQWEYCFARNSEDTSGGGDNGWTCELSEASNDVLKSMFEGRPEEGVADYNSTLGADGINTEADAGDHVKSTAAVLWMNENFPQESVAVMAHIERQGAHYAPSNDPANTSDRGFGWNVEHVRDHNTAAPNVAFGFESQPGHQPIPSRGGYGTNAAGLGTYGGTGCYAGAEAARPGMDFDGTPLTQADFQEGGKYPLVADNRNPKRVTVCRPGVRTMWDALLSEGRRFWSFASSDWHSRGAFGPLDYETTGDFWPGEFQKNYVYIDKTAYADPGKALVAGLRSGNSWHVMGDLVDQLEFEVCAGNQCATMGEALEVRKGRWIRVSLKVRDPNGPNNSPYRFDNPYLTQIGKQVPINEPELAQVDLISGVVHGRMYKPTDPEYYEPMAPATTRIAKTWTQANWSRSPIKTMRYWVKVDEDMYFRARGSNIPAGTPHSRDVDGNPLLDWETDNIPCDDAACPPHVNGVLDADVQAWADVWFYANPVFVKVTR